MPRQTFWKGHLRLSLVTAAVSLTPAVSESGKIRFHVLNRKTGNRVESRYVDSVTHRRVAEKNQVKGFPVEEDRHVLLEESEIDAVALESTRTIDVETFVPAGSIDWIWYDRPHFLRPEDKVGAEAFGVIREAMRVEGVVGIARLMLYRREYAVLLEPAEKGIILWTLHYGEEVREPVETLDSAAQADRELLEALEKRIAKQTTPWTPAMVKDPIQRRLQSLIRSRKGTAGEARERKAAPAKTGGKVVNIMDALKKSLQEERRT